MPNPLQLFGNPADLLRIPGIRIRGPHTAPTFPGRPSLPRSITDSPYPADQPADRPASQSDSLGEPTAASGWNDPNIAAGSAAPAQASQAREVGGMPVSDMLKNPNMALSPGDRAAIAERMNPPQPKKGIRGALGTVFDAIGWTQEGEALKNPGLAAWQSRVKNYEDIGRIQDEAVTRAAQMQNMDLQRREAQQRITESQQRAANAELNAQRASYGRQLENIEKAGGFEAPEIPPSIDRTQMPSALTTIPGSAPNPTETETVNNLPQQHTIVNPVGFPNPLTRIPASVTPTRTDVVNNLPQSNTIMSPGLQVGQSRRLGTVQPLTDPDSGTTRNMVYPSKAVQQEMQQAGWPKVTPEMAATLSDMGLEEGTPLPLATYNKLLQSMQTRQTQAQKPKPAVRPLSVAPGHTLYDPETKQPVYTAPGKPEGDQKPPSRGQFAAIEGRKQTALAKAESDARKRLRGSSTQEPEDSQSVYADLNAQKQQIQDAYESEIEALTGNAVGHFDYSNAPAAAPIKPAAQPGGRTVSEAELRRQAAAAGKDPDAAVQVAKTRGYKLVQ